MNRLKELRKERKLTQQDVADEMNVTKRTYIYWEQEERQIKPEKAQKLADFFGVSVGYLLGFGTIEEELERDQKEMYKLFPKENDALLSLGYLLSDQDLYALLQLIHTMSSRNEMSFWKQIEFKDSSISFDFESDYSSFAEVYPNYLNELQEKYNDYIRRIRNPEESTKIQQRLKMIEEYRNKDNYKKER